MPGGNSRPALSSIRKAGDESPARPTCLNRQLLTSATQLRPQRPRPHNIGRKLFKFHSFICVRSARRSGHMPVVLTRKNGTNLKVETQKIMRTTVRNSRRRSITETTFTLKAFATGRLIFSPGVALAAIAVLALVCQLSIFSSRAVTAQQQPDYQQLKAQAEKLFADGSYARAHDLYANVSKAGLSPQESR